LFGTDLSEALSGGADSVNDLLGRLHDLVGAGISDKIVDVAKKYREAVAEFGFVSSISKTIFGATFLPIITDAIKQFTNFIADNKKALQDWANLLGGKVKSVVSDFFSLLKGQTGGIGNTWLVSLRDGLVSFGNAAVGVFENLVVPAFGAVELAAQSLAGAINSALGTDFSPAALGIVGVLTSLIGGFNALALGVAAVFAGSGPAIDGF
jgi:hypothetical protein